MSEKTKENRLTKELMRGKHFISKCEFPTKDEYMLLLRQHVIGIGFLGVLGYIVRFVHILINNVIVGK
ncbi:hypothetical protein VCUG_02175 [Vavraia culicis subsp. floridensis]|uniref:Protein translocase SEC61 complex gamma subunit, archaeal and eukaryotic n=1 Tax=Vavraia culicis (isolate floridensis) TaxID=948595 RepID=L2GT97_VAVCU|nr:uncharacterized protein VCUG_02175 [Vavraia culicis subsp. floridensis]ELA46330.1 hypothetical protein VCUG_02175 [Vavraia culicis subsp. floridensis]